jgi:hypothetical protein
LWTDYQGHTTKYTASRIGDHVVSDKWAVTMAEPGPNDKFCPPDPSTGLTTNATAGNLGIWMPSSVGRCSSFVTDKLFMDDANGLSTPTVSGGSAYVTVSLRVLPGVSTNPPQFTSAASAQTFYDTPFRFLVTTTGGSIPATLTLSTGGLPNGLTFTDNGDGTAAIAGTISNGGACGVLVGGACGSFTITATNPWGVATQDFNLGFGYAPSATLATTSATFIAGIPNFVTVFSQGAQTPVTWGMMGPNGSPLPSWLSLNDQGDGTAVLIGTPPLGTVAAIPLNISVWSTGSAPGILNFGANFTLNVSDAPGFLTLDAGTFYVGQDSNEFTILPPGGSGPHPLSATVTSGTISITAGKLPQGLIDHSSGTSLTISGIPAAGTGGAYPLTLTATNPSGSISRDVNLEVFEQPRITTDVNMQPNFYQFHQGQRNSFSFTTLGYPDRGQEPMAANQPAPTDPNQALGMYFTVTGLPSGFSASNLDPTGRATGTLTISGTPAQADLGQHVITIKAENGVGTAAEQSFTLNFGRTLGDVNGDGFTDCFDVLALDGAFGRYIGESGYNTRADINNDGAINWADMKLVWTHIDFAGAVTTACQQAKHTPSTPAVFQHTLDGASTSHEDTIIYYITSGGIRDSASLSKGIWTDLHGSGQDLLYLAWDGTLWSARVLDDGVTFRETNTATGEVRISQVLEYQTWDGSHWKVSVIRPSW